METTNHGSHEPEKPQSTSYKNHKPQKPQSTSHKNHKPQKPQKSQTTNHRSHIIIRLRIIHPCVISPGEPAEGFAVGREHWDESPGPRVGRTGRSGVVQGVWGEMGGRRTQGRDHPNPKELALGGPGGSVPGARGTLRNMGAQRRWVRIMPCNCFFVCVSLWGVCFSLL